MMRSGMHLGFGDRDKVSIGIGPHFVDHSLSLLLELPWMEEILHQLTSW
jgi:hypothetical protein